LRGGCRADRNEINRVSGREPIFPAGFEFHFLVFIF
jgi:hypothetical protein